MSHLLSIPITVRNRLLKLETWVWVPQSPSDTLEGEANHLQKLGPYDPITRCCVTQNGRDHLMLERSEFTKTVHELKLKTGDTLLFICDEPEPQQPEPKLVIPNANDAKSETVLVVPSSATSSTAATSTATTATPASAPNKDHIKHLMNMHTLQQKYGDWCRIELIRGVRLHVVPEPLRAIYQEIKRRHIRLVVWDFDQTICESHTGGCVFANWSSEVDEKLNGFSVSRDFVALSSFLNSVGGYQQGIASFASPIQGGGPATVGGYDLISRVVSRAFIESKADKQPEFLVVAFHPSKQDVQTHGKNIHLASLIINTILPSNVLLIDDDIHNLRCAKQAGYHVAHVTERKGFDLSTLAFL